MGWICECYEGWEVAWSGLVWRSGGVLGRSRMIGCTRPLENAFAFIHASRCPERGASI